MAGFKIKLRRNTAALWAVLNPVLDSGEPGLETDTGQVKIGDGITPWLDLDPLIRQSEVSGLVDDAISNIDPTDISNVALEDHINSPTPHPIYDDGPSFVLIYENAKV